MNDFTVNGAGTATNSSVTVNNLLINGQSQAQVQISSSLPSPPASTQTTAPPAPVQILNTPNGILSRSNSQPDLSFNLEKLMQSQNGYGYYYGNNCYNYYPIDGNNNGNMSTNTAAAANQSFVNSSYNPGNTSANHVNFNFNSNASNNQMNAGKIRRHPSLNYKTSMSECNDQNSDYFLQNFNIYDYLPGAGNVAGTYSNYSNQNATNSFSTNGTYYNGGYATGYDTNGDIFSNYNNSNGPNNNNSFNCFNNVNGMNCFNPTNATMTSNTATTYSATTSGVSSTSSLTANSLDDGLFLGIDAITDFLNRNTKECSELFDELPDLEDLMSLVTFETSSSVSAATSSSVCSAPAALQSAQSQSGEENPTVDGNLLVTNEPSFLDDARQHQHTSLDLNVKDLLNPEVNVPTNNSIPTNVNTNTNNNSSNHSNNNNFSGLPNFYDYCCDMELLLNEQTLLADLNNNLNDNENSIERTTRSAPPSPTPQSKKQRPTTNLPWLKAWNKMDDEERSKTVECLTRIINGEMGLREQLEIIRILNPDTKLRPTDTQFVIDLNMIDDEKFRRIKDIIKAYGLSLNEKLLTDNSSDCPLAKRELRIKRAQQRLKLKQKKEQKKALKENKSGLFSKTEVVPLKRVLPEEDTEIDILS